MWLNYKEMYYNVDNEKMLIDKRLEMVRLTNENNIKKAAKFYSCSKNTIKKWCTPTLTRMFKILNTKVSTVKKKPK